MNLHRLTVIASSFALAAGLSACGHKEAHPHDADTEGGYIDAGPITYQVQLSRELSPYGVEDKIYLTGMPAATRAPAPDEEWFAVWLKGINQTGQLQRTVSPANLDILDSQNNHYHPIPLNPAINPYACTATELKPLQTQPAPDSPGYYSATQGCEVLFKINTSAYRNRPLVLEFRNRAQKVQGTVSLDL